MFGKDKAFSEKIINSSSYYYLLMGIIYCLTLILRDLRPGVVGGVLMLVLAVPVLIRTIKKETRPCMADYLILGYFLYRILSAFLVLKNGYPLALYAKEFAVTVLPMIFVLVGRDESTEVNDWYRNFLLTVFLIGGLGICLYAVAPDFYNEWSYQMGYISKADAATTRVRMNSVVGSTILSYLSVVGMLAGGYFLNDKNKKQNAFAICSICFCFLCAVLANQRAGLVCAILVALYLNYIAFFKKGLFHRRYLAAESIIVLAVLLLVGVIRFSWIYKYVPRLLSLPGAIPERMDAWQVAVASMQSVLFGNGIGVNGHKAMEYAGTSIVADGGLVKIFCEEGIVGLFLFTAVVINALRYGIRQIEMHYTEVGIVLVAILTSIGSNMLAFQLCTPIFWYAIGRVMVGRRGKEHS